MMEFFQQLPHLEPYGNPQYFVYVIAATLPIFIGLFFKKRFARILPSGNSSVSFSSCQLSRVVQSIALSDLMKIIRPFLSEMS